MRYDVAYLGKVRKVVDGKGRDVVSFRYDKSTGRPTRVRDRLGNDLNLEWDDAGRPVRETGAGRGRQGRAHDDGGLRQGTSPRAPI